MSDLSSISEIEKASLSQLPLASPPPLPLLLPLPLSTSLSLQASTSFCLISSTSPDICTTQGHPPSSSHHPTHLQLQSLLALLLPNHLFTMHPENFLKFVHKASGSALNAIENARHLNIELAEREVAHAAALAVLQQALEASEAERNRREAKQDVALRASEAALRASEDAHNASKADLRVAQELNLGQGRRLTRAQQESREQRKNIKRMENEIHQLRRNMNKDFVAAGFEKSPGEEILEPPSPPQRRDRLFTMDSESD